MGSYIEGGVRCWIWFRMSQKELTGGLARVSACWTSLGRLQGDPELSNHSWQRETGEISRSGSLHLFSLINIFPLESKQPPTSGFHHLSSSVVLQVPVWHGGSAKAKSVRKRQNSSSCQKRSVQRAQQLRYVPGPALKGPKPISLCLIACNVALLLR